MTETPFENLLARAAAIPATVNARPDILRRGRHLHADMGLAIDETVTVFRINGGVMETPAIQAPVMPSCDFTIRAGADAWAVFWQPKPPPGFHDIMALLRQKRMRFEGRLQPMMAHLFYVKMVLEIPRGCGAAL